MNIVIFKYIFNILYLLENEKVICHLENFQGEEVEDD